MRIGHGYDAHRFGEGCDLILGGVKIPYDRGLLAHSDGDVLIHALCDALLGATALGDINKHFPDSSTRYKNIDSRVLLREVIAQLAARSLRVRNIDATIIAQQPKLAPYVEQMKRHIAADLECDSGQVNIKATTTEKMGFTGRGEGIAAHAVVLLLDR